MCGNLFKFQPGKIILWVLFSFYLFFYLGSIFNILAVSYFVRSKSRTVATLLHGMCIFSNELRCLYVLIILISDSHFGVAYSYLYTVWKEHMLCYVAGVVFIFSGQMYWHSCLGHILLNFYIVQLMS